MSLVRFRLWASFFYPQTFVNRAIATEAGVTRRVTRVAVCDGFLLLKRGVLNENLTKEILVEEDKRI